MNFVYPLGSGSAWNDTELFVSISLLRKYYVGDLKVIVSGEIPKRYVEADEIIKCSIEGTRYVRSTNNLEEAARFLNEPFVIMNDDFYCVKEFTDSDLKLWYDSTITERMVLATSPIYRKALHMSQRHKEDLNFALHRPMIITDLDMFYDSAKDAKRMSCSLRNLYGNRIQENRAKEKDIKANKPIILDGVDWFSISDRFVRHEINKQWLLNLM